MGRYTLFADRDYCDRDYHREFPTIYHLRRALMYSNGDISTFVTSPISCVFLVAAAISIVLTIRKQLNDRKKATA